MLLLACRQTNKEKIRQKTCLFTASIISTSNTTFFNISISVFRLYKNRKEFELPCHNHNAVKLVLKTRIKIDLQNIFKQTKFKHCFLSIFKISVIIRDAWMLTH